MGVDRQLTNQPADLPDGLITTAVR